MKPLLILILMAFIWAYSPDAYCAECEQTLQQNFTAHENRGVYKDSFGNLWARTVVQAVTTEGLQTYNYYHQELTPQYVADRASYIASNSPSHPAFNASIQAMINHFGADADFINNEFVLNNPADSNYQNLLDSGAGRCVRRLSGPTASISQSNVSLESCTDTVSITWGTECRIFNASYSGCKTRSPAPGWGSGCSAWVYGNFGSSPTFGAETFGWYWCPAAEHEMSEPDFSHYTPEELEDGNHKESQDPISSTDVADALFSNFTQNDWANFLAHENGALDQTPYQDALNDFTTDYTNCEDEGSTDEPSNPPGLPDTGTGIPEAGEFDDTGIIEAIEGLTQEVADDSAGTFVSDIVTSSDLALDDYETLRIADLDTLNDTMPAPTGIAGLISGSTLFNPVACTDLTWVLHGQDFTIECDRFQLLRDAFAFFFAVMTIFIVFHIATRKPD